MQKNNATLSRRRSPLKMFFALITISLSISSAHADDSAKQLLIRKVEMRSMKSAFFGPDSPLLDSMLASARAANPNVSQSAWGQIKVETSTAIISTLSGPGSFVSAVMDSPLCQLSVGELEHLDAMLNDPVILKYQSAMADPSNQRAMMRDMTESELKMQAAINNVLKRHGLNAPSP
jgi:hypothetical protein